MNTLIKLLVCVLLMLGLLLCTVSCSPDEKDEQGVGSEVSETDTTEGETETEEEGTGLSDKGNLDSPNLGPIVRV